jgi:BASS family bile acid:Na+ symporter
VAFYDHAVAERYLIPAQLVMAMVGMGATLRIDSFTAIARRPASLGLGLAVQWVLVPLAAVLVARLAGLGPGWAVGLLLVAVAPGGAMSNLLTFLGRGNLPLCIAMTAFTTLGCVVTVPVLLRMLAASHLPESFSLPTGRVVAEIFGYLLVPLAVGMAVNQRAPSRAPWLARWGIRGSLVLIAVLTVGALGSGRIKLAAYGLYPPAVIFAFGAVLALVVPQVSRLAGRYDDDTVTVAIQVAIRNMGLGLLLVRYFFDGQPEQGQTLFVCLFWAGLAPVFAVPSVLLHRAGWRVVPWRRAYPRP